MLAMLIFILIYVLCIGGSFLITAGLVKLVCICFGIAFTWKIALGIWIVTLILGIKPTIKVESKYNRR